MLGRERSMQQRPTAVLQQQSRYSCGGARTAQRGFGNRGGGWWQLKLGATWRQLQDDKNVAGTPGPRTPQQVTVRQRPFLGRGLRRGRPQARCATRQRTAGRQPEQTRCRVRSGAEPGGCGRRALRRQAAAGAAPAQRVRGRAAASSSTQITVVLQSRCSGSELPTIARPRERAWHESAAEILLLLEPRAERITLAGCHGGPAAHGTVGPPVP
jgi:hypothetical protein